MNNDKHEFHLEEFKQLKSEIQALIEGAQKLMRYALVIAASVFAWLAVQGVAHDQTFCTKLPKFFLMKAWFIPCWFAIFGGIVAAIGAIRLFQMSEYLREIEIALGISSLGWENWLNSKSPIFTSLGTIFWILLVIVLYCVGHEAGQFIEPLSTCKEIKTS